MRQTFRVDASIVRVKWFWVNTKHRILILEQWDAHVLCNKTNSIHEECQFIVLFHNKTLLIPRVEAHQRLLPADAVTNQIFNADEITRVHISLWTRNFINVYFGYIFNLKSYEMSRPTNTGAHVNFALNARTMFREWRIAANEDEYQIHKSFAAMTND